MNGPLGLSTHVYTTNHGSFNLYFWGEKHPESEKLFSYVKSKLHSCLYKILFQLVWHLFSGCQNNVNCLFLGTKRKFRHAFIVLDNLITIWMHVFAGYNGSTSRFIIISLESAWISSTSCWQEVIMIYIWRRGGLNSL